MCALSADRCEGVHPYSNQQYITLTEMNAERNRYNPWKSVEISMDHAGDSGLIVDEVQCTLYTTIVPYHIPYHVSYWDGCSGYVRRRDGRRMGRYPLHRRDYVDGTADASR